MTRELLEELIKEIRVSGEDTLEIVWNFKEPDKDGNAIRPELVNQEKTKEEPLRSGSDRMAG